MEGVRQFTRFSGIVYLVSIVLCSRIAYLECMVLKTWQIRLSRCEEEDLRGGVGEGGNKGGRAPPSRVPPRRGPLRRYGGRADSDRSSAPVNFPEAAAGFAEPEGLEAPRQ